MIQLKIESLETIHKAAQNFLTTLPNKRVFAFYGAMGAGKTTFIKALCETLGVTETVSSPTFAIINEYKGKNNQPIYHFDFYRIKSEEEAFDFGYEDYFYSKNYCFIEWPERIASLIPEDCISVTIKEENDGSRTIQINE